ncbi:MAG TPA: DUF4870 domain-containing protein [Candidatus Cybelea sp.]|jgi:hypothetical protein|nr:DUF4870 domain-containing protein [Candidatus Cybelea sp.]
MQASITAQERNWAMAAHLGALVAVAGLPFGHVLGPLIVYLIKGHESPFVGEHARASLNYQITLSILGIIAILIGVGFTLGFIANSGSAEDAMYGIAFATLWVSIGVAILVVLLMSVIFIIIGTLAAADGRPFTYPFAIRFLR